MIDYGSLSSTNAQPGWVAPAPLKDPLGIGELTTPWWAGAGNALRRIKNGGFQLGKASNIW